MTNFLIGFPDLQAKAVRTQTTDTFSDDTPLKNILGRRGLASKLATAATGLKVVEFDSGATDTADHLYLARADRLSNSGVSRVSVRGSDASFFYPSSTLFTSYLDGSRGVTLSSGRVSAWADQLGLLSNFTQGTAAARPYITECGNVENLIKYSEQLDNAVHTQTRLSVSANSIANPINGAITADTLIENAASASHYLGVWNSTTFTVVANTAIRLSVYAKRKERDVCLRIQDSGSVDKSAYFNLSGAGAVTSVASGATASIESLGSGWYRCAITATPTTSGACYPTIHMIQAGGSGQSYLGDGASGVYCFGVQVSDASAATDYLATTDLPRFRGVNGNRALHFDGAQRMDSTSLMSALVGVSGKLCYVAFRASKISATHRIIMDADGTTKFAVYADTGALTVRNYDGSSDTHTGQALTNGQIVLARIRHNGTNIYSAIDTGSGFGAETSTASGASSSLGGALYLGAQSASNYFFGDICCIATSSGSTADATLETMLRARFLTAATTDTFALSSETLIGPRGDDYLEEFTETSAKRYFWIEFDSETTSSTNDLDSLFIGKWFDFETEPGSWRIGKRYNSGSEMASSGTGDIKRKGDQRYTLNIIWNNITDAKAKEFMDEAREIYKRRRQFILRSTSPAAILDSKTVLHVEFAEHPRIEKTASGYNIISCRFIEVLG